MTDLTFQRENLLVAPGTLRAWQGEQAVNYRSVVAAQFDDIGASAELTGKARSPLLCDASILPYHARDRLIRRYATESENSWRIRLSKWHQIWASAGRAWGILRQLRIFLAPYGRPLLRYVSTSGNAGVSQWFTLEPGDGVNDYFELGGLDPEFSRAPLQSPANWIWDADASDGHYSRYWILIYTSGITNPVAQAEWDGGEDWDGGAIWDGYLPADVIADAALLSQEWDAQHSSLGGLFLVHDDTAFDPTGSGAGYPDGTWDLVGNRRDGVTYSVVRT